MFNLVSELGVDPRDIGAVDATARRLRTAPLWVGIGVAGAALLAVAAVGAVALFVERWYAYRLTREPDGSLRVRHGLLTRRSLSVSAERLRGAEVVEPLLLRAGRGARSGRCPTGCARAAAARSVRPHPAPRPTDSPPSRCRALPSEVTRAALRRHPPAALRRRLTRAVLPGRGAGRRRWTVDAPGRPRGARAAPGRGPAGGRPLPRPRPHPHRAPPRHATAGLRRRTVALQRDGVIGWTFRQTVLQRRAGLVTAEAVTAAGRGGYPVLDADACDAVALADATTPGLLAPFRPARPAPTRS